MRVSITSSLVQHSPNGRRVCIRIVTFEACSGFTRVTAHRIAQPPKVTFVTRLRSRQLPSETARQLPDLSTIIRVEPSSTDDSRLQGALPITDIQPLGHMVDDAFGTTPTWRPPAEAPLPRDRSRSSWRQQDKSELLDGPLTEGNTAPVSARTSCAREVPELALLPTGHPPGGDCSVGVRSCCTA